MNRRIMLLTGLICLAIIVACGLAASLYYTGVTIPAISTKELLLSQNNSTQTAIISQATDSVVQTMAAIPTGTPSPTPTTTLTIPPQQVLCDATMPGNSRAIYPVPSQGHTYFNKLVEANSNVKILGRLADGGWYKVEANGQQGWIKSDALKIKDNCRPTIYDLHYLADWLGTDEQLILDDTFATNANIWINDLTNDNFLAKTNQQGEAFLDVRTEKGEVLVTTSNPRLNSLSAFSLYTSFSVNSISDQSYIGIRFRNNNNNYYQIILYPAGCNISVYATGNLVFSNEINPRICIDRYYDMSLMLSTDYMLMLQLNGFDPIPINLQDPDGRYSHGNIGLIANEAEVQFDYLVVVSPK